MLTILRYLIDQRNHGRSPHADEFSYMHLSNDLHQYILENHLNDVIIIGHSLGGKTAMQFAVSYPELLSKLIIVDVCHVLSHTSRQNY